MESQTKGKNKKPLNPKNVKKEEMVKAIIDIGGRQNESMRYVNQLDRLFGLYIDMEDNRQKFNDFIAAKMKEKERMKDLLDDKETNAVADAANIPTDTGDSGAGTEGIRQEA